MNKILVLQTVRPHHRAAILEAGQGYEVVFGQDLTKAQREEILPQAVAILGEPSLEKVKRATNLRWIQMTWAGADRYTMSQEFPDHVVLTTATGAYGAVISEYVLGALLTAHRNGFDYHDQQKTATWADCGSTSMEGKTALILGAGDVGTETAKRLRGFGVTSIGIARSYGMPRPSFAKVYGLDRLDGLLSHTDMVIGCLPNTAETAGLLNRARLLSMKPDAILVNVGRGSLIPLDDLVAVLQTGHLHSVFLDVLEQEPLPESHPLWQMERVHLTPHIAGIGFGHAPQTEDKVVDIFCQNLRTFSRGLVLKNQVNFQMGYGIK